MKLGKVVASAKIHEGGITITQDKVEKLNDKTS